jgi:hypothetical protein
MVERRFLGGLILATLFAGTTLAAEPPTTAVIGTPPQPGWSLLRPEQKEVLSPLAADWDKMDNIRRKKWLGIVDRYPKMTPDEQRRVQERMREWAALTPDQRAKIRDSYREFNQLPAEQKQVVKQKWEAYSSLPPDEKDKVRQGGKSSRLLATPADQPPTAEGVPPEVAGSPASPAGGNEPPRQ